MLTIEKVKREDVQIAADIIQSVFGKYREAAVAECITFAWKDHDAMDVNLENYH